MENKTENKSEVFSFTYSAKEQEETKKIRQKYLPKENDKMEQLRRLDQHVVMKSTAISIAVGICGALILGIGLCCVMVWMGRWFVPGIIIGIVGIVIAALATPVYKCTLKKEQEKIAPEIMRLTDELMK